MEMVRYGSGGVLSLLVCSIPSRKLMLSRLMQVLLPQLTDDVEVIVGLDAGDLTIGAKRNKLVKASVGKWIAFIDDDDLVHPAYVAKILKALELNPDAVGFGVERLVDGVPSGLACHSARYNAYATTAIGTKILFERTPNHLNPIRRELVLKTMFLSFNHGEDTDFANRINRMIDSEVFIDEILYTYLYRSADKREETDTNANKPAMTPAEWFAGNGGVK